ncbi:MAG TPA: hypothetical protein VFJ74_13205 [Gemmatimonadaceae bacterium]|nr:hypothetical protein [Gemmatimonadaceae bacterium]
MAHAQLPIAPSPADVTRRRRFGATMRRDAWWVQSAITFVVLGAFVVYATWAAFQGAHYSYGPYLSPFYSPLIFGEPPHAWFGPKPAWWPGALPYSAALLILWAPGGFRFTCYYYRGAYYKAFWADPPACTVGEPRKKYRGERSFPLVVQNVHRYFLYLALPFLVVLAHDVVEATRFADPTAPGGTRFGIGVGTLVLALNVTLLGGYTLGCHALRHVVGGYLDQLARRPVRKAAYDCVSCLNRAHMRWAWASLVGVAFADLYVRLCAMGIWTDWRIL